MIQALITLENLLFGAVKLTKDTDSQKYSYSGNRIGFDACSSFSLLSGGGFGKNVIIFGVHDSCPTHTDNRKKDILILGKGPTNELNDTTITAEVEYSINFTETVRIAMEVILFSS